MAFKLSGLEEMFSEAIYKVSEVPEKWPYALYPSIPEIDVPIVSIIKPDLANGPWIAGGAALGWYKGESMADTDGDIDIFFVSYEQLQDTANRLNNATKSMFQKYDSKYAKTYEVNLSDKSWTIQLIKCRYMEQPQDIIDAFDISVCEVVTDGNKFLLGQNTAYDIRNSLLRFKYPLREDAIKRYAKYYAYGYRPVEGTWERVVNNPQGKKAFAADEDYHNVF